MAGVSKGGSSGDEGSHLTVQDFAQALRAGWKLICAVVLVALLGAFAYVLLAAPQYQAGTRLFVSTPSDGTNSETNDGGLFAQHRVLSYTQLLKGGVVAQRTIDKLGLDMSAAQLQAEITAEAPTETVVIDVTVTDPSPSRARDIANTLSDEFVVMAAELETPVLGVRPNAQVIVQQRASIPQDPVSPKKTRIIGIAAVLGVIFGVVLAVLWDRLRGRVQRPETVEDITGVGVIGEIASPKRRDALPIAFDGEDSPTADAFRALRVNLQNLELPDGPRVVLVAGTVSGEGRTTTAINLALAVAEAGATVVLLDGDLRRPHLGDVLGLRGTAGLSEVLAGTTPLTDVVQTTSFPGVSAIRAGATSSNPAALLGSPTVKTVLGELSSRFDYVIVDSPPLTVKDAAVLAPHTGGVLLVIRYGWTRRRQLAESVNVLRRAGAPLLGAVLTAVPARRVR